jgi:hypothetical protein
MTVLLPKYKRATIYAMVGAIFHVLVVVLPLLITAGKVKFIGYLFLIFDFPLFLVGLFIPESLRFIFNWMSETTWLSLIGTFMYAFGGWFLGRARDGNMQRYKKSEVADIV